MAKTPKPTTPVVVSVSVGGLPVYGGQSSIELQRGMLKFPDDALNALVRAAVLKQIPGLRVQDVARLRLRLRQELTKGDPDTKEGQG